MLPVSTGGWPRYSLLRRAAWISLPNGWGPGLAVGGASGSGVTKLKPKRKEIYNDLGKKLTSEEMEEFKLLMFLIQNTSVTRNISASLSLSLSLSRPLVLSDWSFEVISITKNKSQF